MSIQTICYSAETLSPGILHRNYFNKVINSSYGKTLAAFNSCDHLYCFVMRLRNDIISPVNKQLDCYVLNKETGKYETCVLKNEGVLLKGNMSPSADAEV